MTSLKFCKGYREHEKLRTSFNELATLVFGLNFENWYQKGFWSDRYIPFSYVEKDQVIANVSVNVLDLVINNEKKKAIQLGTVMTHPNFRNRGLSAGLINKVLEEYDNQYDFMYLFANKSVLNFYPKFGFKAVNEFQFSMDYQSGQREEPDLRRLDGTNIEDLNFIYEFAIERAPISTRFGTINTPELLMFYCIYVFKNAIYYLHDEEAIVIYEQENRRLNLFDIISKKEIDIQRILSKITHPKTDEIVFHFTPDYSDIHTQVRMFKGNDVLFVKTGGENVFPSFIKHPLTSQA